MYKKKVAEVSSGEEVPQPKPKPSKEQKKSEPAPPKKVSFLEEMVEFTGLLTSFSRKEYLLIPGRTILLSKRRYPRMNQSPEDADVKRL